MHEILLFTAKYLYLVVGLIAVIYWLTVSKQEKVRLVIFGVVTALVAFALVKIGAAIYYDPRPFTLLNVVPLYPHSLDNGFPSDHTVLTAVIALVIFSASKRLGLLLLFLALCIGISRVVGNIHHPVDILGSFVFAGIGFMAATYITPYGLKLLKRKNEHVSPN